jgi:hypothetical protein
MPLDKQASRLATNLYNFMKEKFGFLRDPQINFVDDEENAANILGMTGHYSVEDEIITVYITNRLPKDVLRSFAHELMHHVQSHEGMNDVEGSKAAADQNYIMKDKHLRKIEADAFERGNIAFREWEAIMKGAKPEEEEVKETKIPKKGKKHKQFKAGMQAFEKAVSKADFIKKYGKKEGERIYYATATNAGKRKAKLKEGLDMEKKPENEKEVVVNDALKNSMTYMPEERVCAEAYQTREERVYEELLKKFGIKK